MIEHNPKHGHICLKCIKLLPASAFRRRLKKRTGICRECENKHGFNRAISPRRR